MLMAAGLLMHAPMVSSFTAGTAVPQEQLSTFALGDKWCVRG
jgi:hypothetical protein